ncbi:MAG TPA: glycosyltransferase [Candidatus Moranbacteria bacterium]|nr:glycosyltransferase [Candidatus Moranbacteria bacterium]
MKLWLIKLGKVLAAVKRDGLRGGSRKAFEGLRATAGMLFVPAGDVLIVTSGVGDSARYRAHHVAEELRLNGLRVSVTVQDNPFLPFFVRRFGVFVFHRALYLGATKRLFDRAKKSGKTIVFETDDLVYDPKYLADMDYYNQMSPLEKLQYKNGVGGEMLADPYVRAATVTTSYLADKLRQKDKEVFIITNKLSREDISWTEEYYRRREKILSERDTVREDCLSIGYFSGTLSHNKDFATITPALSLILTKYPQVKVAIFGPLDLDENLDKFKDRFIQNPFVPRREYFGNVAGVDIAVAPLELGNPFCEAKSELKFFEPGSMAVPTVAVANRTFSEAIEDGRDGFLAADTEEWVEKLSLLIEDPALRRRLGARAREKVLRRYVTTAETEETARYLKYLRERLS